MSLGLYILNDILNSFSFACKNIVVYLSYKNSFYYLLNIESWVVCFYDNGLFICIENER